MGKTLTTQLLAVPQAPPDATYLDPADAKIREIYDALRTDLERGQTATRDIFARGTGAVGSAYDQASSAAQAGTGGALDVLRQEAARLGIERALPESSQELTTDLAGFLSRMAGGKATDVAGLSQLGTGFEAIGQMGIDSSRKEMAQQRTDVMSQLRKALLGLRQQETGAVGDLNSGLLQIALQQAQGETEIDKLRAALEADKAQYAAARASSRGGGAGGPSISEQIALMKLPMQLQLLEKQLQGPAPKAPNKGQAALDWFYNNFAPYKGKGGAGTPAGPVFRSGVAGIIAQAQKQAATNAFNNKRLGVNRPTDPWTVATSYVNRGMAPALSRGALLTALDYYYGRK